MTEENISTGEAIARASENQRHEERDSPFTQYIKTEREKREPQRQQGIQTQQQPDADTEEEPERVEVPQDNRDDERLTGPESYDLRKPDTWPEGLPYDEKMVEHFKARFYQGNVPKDVAADIFSEYNAYILKQFQKMHSDIQRERNDHISKLKTHYGPRYNQALEMAGAAARVLGGQDLVDLLNNSGNDGHFIVVKALAKAGEMLNLSKNTYVEPEPQYAESGSLLDTERKQVDGGLTKKDIENMMLDKRYGSDKEYSERVSRAWRRYYND